MTNAWPSPPAARDRRRRSSLEFDERILDAGFDLLIERGVDGFGLRDVAARLGVSHTPIYGRYDHRNELLADLWQRRAVDDMRALIGVARGEDAELTAAVAHGDRLPRRLAAVELAGASWRIDELADVVPRDIANALAAVGALQPDGSVDVSVLGRVALLVGTVVITALLPSAVDNVAVALRSVTAHLEPWAGPRPAPVPTTRLWFDDTAPERERLLSAASIVTARSGLAATTLNRIGRVAGIAPTSLYAVYPTRGALVHDMVERHGRLDRAPDRSVAAAGLFEAPAAILSGWCQDDSRAQRRFVLEVYLGANHDGVVGEVLMRGFHAGIDDIVDRLAVTPAHRRMGRASTEIHATLSVGMMLIVEAMGYTWASFVDADWRPFSSSLTAGLFTNG